MNSINCSNLNTENLTHAKVFIFANGCHENHMDAELLKNYLTNEFEVTVVNRYQDSDLVLIQGCSVTEHMENESKQFINFMKEKKENDSIVVLGCLSKFRPETIIDESKNLIPLDEIEQNLYRMGDLANKYTANTLYANPSQTTQFVEEHKENAINGYFGYENNIAVKGFILSRLYNSLLFFKKGIEKRLDLHNQNVFCIKVSTGCSGKCTYCSIRMGRGKIKSKSIDDIVREFNKGIELGYKHIGLMGTDIGDYGKEINSDLYELLSRLLDIKGDYKIKLRNVSPRWLIPNYPKLIPWLKSKQIIYLQSPIQSGSDEILELMNREYTSDAFLQAARALKAASPDLVLRTQLIVGFPTENEQQFKESKKILESGLFDYIDVFRFTKRKGTTAADIYPEVPMSTIVTRYRELFLKTLFHRPVRKLKAVKTIYYDSF